MIFNSFEFALFLPIVFLLYWFAFNQKIRVQNILLLLASYVFYAWWDWRFLSLIIFSSTVDFFTGLALGRQASQKRRKLLLWLSISVNIGFLAFFKYFNFFAESFAQAFTLFGKPFSVQRLNIILPVGISFYTFQTLSYTIDVYKNKLRPTKDIVAFFAFVSFFPQLVAGPIERATHLLPQFLKKRQFDYDKASDGLKQMLWGLFKKIVIADNCAVFVNDIFANYNNYNGITLILGAVFFAFQIYGDFSGYSDIAIGTARLFGFNLKQNFAFPYFSRDIAEFWRRWHISLSTWFRDYVYIPLGGSRGNLALKIRNIFIIFAVSGFWHGANWTFILWGILHALYYLPLLIAKKNRKYVNHPPDDRMIPPWQDIVRMAITFIWVCIAWVFFRADSVVDAMGYLTQMFTAEIIAKPQLGSNKLVLQILFMLLIEWLQRNKLHALEFNNIRMAKPVKWAFFYLVIFFIAFYGGDQEEFIYFQF